MDSRNKNIIDKLELYDREKLTTDNITALHLAVMMEKVEVVRWLLTKTTAGSSADKNKHGMDIFILAANTDNKVLIKVLIDEWGYPDTSLASILAQLLKTDKKKEDLIKDIELADWMCATAFKKILSTPDSSLYHWLCRLNFQSISNHILSLPLTSTFLLDSLKFFLKKDSLEQAFDLLSTIIRESYPPQSLIAQMRKEFEDECVKRCEQPNTKLANYPFMKKYMFFLASGNISFKEFHDRIDFQGLIRLKKLEKMKKLLLKDDAQKAFSLLNETIKESSPVTSTMIEMMYIYEDYCAKQLTSAVKKEETFKLLKQYDDFLRTISQHAALGEFYTRINFQPNLEVEKEESEETLNVAPSYRF